jgi:error-prone DNA polymerase
LRAMSAGREVVEDYRSLGLSLRQHPVAFLRGELKARKIVDCASAGALKDGTAVQLAGMVLVRQRPGSAKGVLFITLEDETGIANLVIWPKLFEENRRTVMSAGMLGIKGYVQREGEVVHVIALKLTDLTPLLQSVGDRNEAFPLPDSRADHAKHGGGPDPRDTLGRKARDIYVRNQHLDNLKIKPRNRR